MSSDLVATHLTGRPSARARRRPILDVHGGLGAEPAADPRAHHARNSSRAQPRRRGQGIAGRVGRLVGHPEGDAAVRLTRHGEHAVVLHRRTEQPLADHRDLGHDIGPLQRVDVLADFVPSRRSSRARGTGAAHRAQALGRRHHEREGLALDDHRLGGVDRLLAISATTAATTSPTKRTRSLANTGRASAGGIIGNSGNGASPRSSPSTSPARPASTRRGDVDRRQRGMGERRAHEAHVGGAGTSRSSTYLPAPVSRSGSSRRTTALPRSIPTLTCGSLSPAPAPRWRLQLPS